MQSWDTANKVTELLNYSVCTTWGVRPAISTCCTCCVSGLIIRTSSVPCVSRRRYHHASVVLIEDRASGTQLIQEFVAEGLGAVTRYAPSGDKVMRFHAQTGMIENRLVHLPVKAPWLAEYQHKLTTFPHSRYDDEFDSTAQALDWLKQALHNQNQGWDWYLPQPAYNGARNTANIAGQGSPCAPLPHTWVLSQRHQWTRCPLFVRRRWNRLRRPR